jgi:DNA-binding beta-propeller fold protein YncE
VVLALFLISVTLVSPTSILPLAYSQGPSYVANWNQAGEGVPRLSGPSGIAIDPSSGNVYVADTENQRINIYSSNGTFVSEFGRYGEGDGRFRSPEGIALDQEGNVYVADTGNHRIQVFSSNGTFLTGWGEYGADSATFASPEGIALDQEGNVYVADTGNHRIQVFSSNGTFLEQWGVYGEEDGSFRSPEGIALDQEGNVYVADTENNRIQVFSSNGTFLEQWGEYGDGDGSFRFPEGIAVGQQGNVYVADTGNNRIQVFSSNGTLIREWGGRYGSGDGEMRSPAGIALDQEGEGNVYVADTGNNRIQVFSSNGTFITKWGDITKWGEYSSGNSTMRSPAGIALDQEGNLYVADTGNSLISAWTLSSPISNVAFSSEEGEIYGNNTRVKIERIYDGLNSPTAIAFLGSNDMLVLEQSNNKIMRIVNGQMLDEPVLDLDLDLGNTIRNLNCMCDIAILQNNNGTSYAFVYIYQAEVTEDDGITKVVNRLYRYDITNGKFANPKLFFEIPSPKGVHDGGKLMIGPDNNIYVTIGDIKGFKTKAQNVKNGSLPDGSSGILRFTPEGEPVDGGLLGNTHPLDKYYAYGIRNSFGMDYDPFTGNIWITDNGPSFGDELNLVRPGFNGGWRETMGFSSFDKAFDLTNLESFNGTGKYYDPIFEWFDSVGVTDLVFVPSDKLGKEYEGNLFVGDYNSGSLYRFILNQTRTGLLLNGSLSDGGPNNNLERLEAVFAKIEGGIAGITDLDIGPDGLVYIVSQNGKILRLEPMPS